MDDGSQATKGENFKDGAKEEKSADSKGLESAIDCNICFEVAMKPVITMCGHMFCWPCIHQWLESNQTSCPVCRAGISRDNLIPFFGRGSVSTEDPRSSDPNIPERPTRPRAEPTPRRRGFAPAFSNIFHSDFADQNSHSFSAFTLFPGMFGFQMEWGGNHANVNENGVNANDPNQGFASSIFSLVAIVLIFAVIFY
uniref:RING-type E3 ubiquitin transferase n=1 Tax=Spongospora subterranea TaxID=70186 RepID=A0A0H5QZD9_9EUKA|eukprot:CRZ00929.1 hypothetical protein [Spongospora subterranea]